MEGLHCVSVGLFERFAMGARWPRWSESVQDFYAIGWGRAFGPAGAKSTGLNPKFSAREPLTRVQVCNAVVKSLKAVPPQGSHAASALNDFPQCSMTHRWFHYGMIPVQDLRAPMDCNRKSVLLAQGVEILWGIPITHPVAA